MEIHRIRPELLEREVRVLVVGCGGTGSAFVATGRNRWVDQGALDEELKHGSIDHLVLPIDQPFLPRLRGYLRRRGNFGKGTR